MVDIVADTTVPDLWDDIVRRAGERTFLVYEADDGAVARFTYAEFDALINKAAGVFADLGVRPGERVGLQLCNSPAFVQCLFALAKLGAVCVPVDPKYRREETAYILSRCGISTLVTEEYFLETYAAAVEGTDPTVRHVIVAGSAEPIPGTIRLEDAVAAASPHFAAARRLSSGDVAEILFTSGTTSAAKGVELTHANMVYAGYYGNWQAAMRPDDVLLTTMPAWHSNFQLAALMPVLTAGCVLVMVEHYHASRFWKQICDFRATLTQAVSMMIRTMLMQPEEPWEREHRVREVMYYMPMSDAEKTRFETRFGATICNSFGSTETVVWSVTDPPFGPRRWPSVGRAGLGIDVRLLDPAGRDVPPGQTGEFAIKGVPGRTLMRGYFEDPEATARVMTHDGYLLTGDTGIADEDGWFYFIDRNVNIIKRAGENVSATEVEDVLAAHPLVAEVAVVGVPDAVRDEAVKAFVVLRPGAKLTEQEVIAYSAEHLAPFKVPSIVEFTDALPKTSTAKVKKAALR